MTTDHPAGTLVSILRSRAEVQGGDLLYRWLTTGDVDGGVQTLTYAQADRHARAIAVRVQVDCAPGDRVVLLYPPGLDFVLGFLGTLYAGAPK